MMSKILLRKKMFGTLVQVPCVIRVLLPGDEKEACSFYTKIAKSISDPEIFIAEHTIPSDINGEGLVIGVYDEKGLLICLRILTRNREVLSHYADMIGEKGIDRALCSDGCIVDQVYRGNNLQFLSWFYAETLISEKYDFAVSTVSPKNIFSLNNMLACGFLIVGVSEMYGGYKRFIMRKDFSGETLIRTAGHFEIDIHDEQMIARAISEGCVGYKTHRRSSGVNVLLGTRL